MHELEDLLAPISDSRPCGWDLAFSTEYDRIQEARRSDDPTLEQGEWITDLKSADWPSVFAQSARLLQQRTKDLQLAVWFTEAAVRTRGLRGLALGYRTVAGLCDRYWDALYPSAEEDGDHEQRIGNIRWLLTHSPTWLKEIPIAQGAQGRYGQIHFDMAHSRSNAEEVAESHGLPPLEALETMRRNTPHNFYRELMEAIPDCQEALKKLEASVDARLGIDGPSFSAAHDQLLHLDNLVRRFAREAGMLLDCGDEVSQDGGDTAPTSEGATQAAVPSFNAQPNSRKEALMQLRRVAEFFRRTEPHSPVAYLADKAARWGEMPLHIWLKRVIKDDSTLAQVEELLDVDEFRQGDGKP